MEAENYERRARVFAALSDPTRLRLVDILAAEDTLCGSDLAEQAGISLALLSHHWKVLTEAGLTTRTRHGQRQYCSLNREALAEAFEGLWPYRKLTDRPKES
jgi:DNA-binding transcriptional ArsR family regulator